MAERFAIALGLTLFAAIGVHAQEFIEGTVTRFADGDSLRIGGTGIRLDGIDSPERKDRCAHNGAVWKCATPAARALRDIVGSSSLHCAYDYCDRKNRRVSICRADGRDVGEEMVRLGWAVDWPLYSNHRYKAAQDEARLHKRGLWADGVELSPRLRERVKSTPADFTKYRCK